MREGRLDRWKTRVRELQSDTCALILAYRDPRTPWYAKVLAAAVVAYALSPIDLIPDIIPVLGLLDDLLIVPAGMAVAVKLIPDGVMDECRARARLATAQYSGRRRVAAAIVVCVWIIALVIVGLAIARAAAGKR
jgi:uncharacterized membrane protein YkvA (DUF1232 family)